eukprot:1157396-Pelagomonas_calceolata.AAC.2
MHLLFQLRVPCLSLEVEVWAQWERLKWRSLRENTRIDTCRVDRWMARMREVQVEKERERAWTAQATRESCTLRAVREGKPGLKGHLLT